MATKQDGFDQAVKSLLKKAPAAATPAEPRAVLEEVLYGICREGATSAQADRAYACLKDDFFDWNEVRVSTVQEIATAMKGLPQAGAKAKRMVEFLQELFELDYNFSLQGIDKKGMKQAAKQLARYPGMSDFVVAWVTQRSLGGHAIPLDDAGVRVLVQAGAILAEEAEDREALRGRLEHAVNKADGPAFTEALAEAGATLRAAAKVAKAEKAEKAAPTKPKKPKAK